jgi:hypothetical protein
LAGEWVVLGIVGSLDEGLIALGVVTA